MLAWELKCALSGGRLDIQGNAGASTNPSIVAAYNAQARALYRLQ